MWKASAGHKINENIQPDDDDWETDPDFVNDVNEQEQRWGSKTIEGSGRTAGSINMQQLREETENADAQKKKKEIEEINPGYGYGGKYGVQTDRMDKSAVGHDYVGKVEKHASQKDYSDGFGGKYGVQTDRVDKSAVSWDHIEKVEKHSSQKDYATGFGGKFGVQTDRVDKSAVGWDHIEKVEKHESQKDYAKGFGGKFGVEEDRKDKSAVGWDYIEAPQKHESQLDHKVGFGGKFGVQKDRVDKSAVSWDHIEKVEKHSSQKDYAAGFGGKFGVQSDRVDKSAVGWDHIEKVEKHESQKGFDVKQCIDKSVKSLNDNKEPNSENVKTEKKNLRAQFENLAKNSEDEIRKKTEEQKRLREIKDKQDREQASKKTIVENTPQMTTEEVITTARKIAIDTGRSGGIGNAISAFNQMQSPTVEQPVQRKEQIKLPKQIEQPQIQPNVIPDVIQDVVEPKPVRSVQFLNDANKTAQKTDIESVDRDIHTAQSINIKSNQPEAARESIVEPPLQFTEVNDPIYQNQEELNEQSKEEAIYQNQDDFIEYIEDTGVKAIALYDYQAAADDEISFDPDDIITHIEMIDEGWWRGMCKNRYGLFPANYVQLVEQQQT